MRVTVLGCGGSGGVPLATGEWGVCDPTNPKNRRRRPSILIEDEELTILVDTGPDVREQLLDAACRRIDAILYTHAHADHVHGLDDLRAFNNVMGRPIDAFGTEGTLAAIRERFAYAFEAIEPGHGFYRPQLIARIITEYEPFRVGHLDVLPFRQDHGLSLSTGFRIGRFAYSTDVVGLDEQAFEALTGVEVWIVDCLREWPHITHAHLAQTLEWIDRVGAERAILTHMNHQADYDVLAAKLPPGVEPGYDGLVLEL